MPLGARTPEELETLLEDSCVVEDDAMLAELLDDAAVVLAGDGTVRRGMHAARGLRVGAAGTEGCYCADPRVVLQSGELALILSPASTNVVRRGSDRCWRLVISVLRGDSALSTGPLDEGVPAGPTSAPARLS